MIGPRGITLLQLYVCVSFRPLHFVGGHEDMIQDGLCQFFRRNSTSHTLLPNQIEEQEFFFYQIVFQLVVGICENVETLQICV